MNTDNLSPVFHARPAAERERLQKLMRTVSENSLTGAEVLKQAENTSLLFHEFSGTAGSYLPYFNTITLNPLCSDTVLFSALVHEARHAVQKIPEVKNPDIWTQIQLNRTTEADAMAVECAAAFEARKTKPAVWETFALAHSKVAAAYSDSVCKTPSETAALASAFKAWFDDRRYVDRYDEKETELFLLCPEKTALTSAQILRAVCRAGAEEYMSAEADFLYSDRASIISENVYGIYERKNAEREGDVSKVRKDFSLTSFFAVTPTGDKRFGKNSEKARNLKNILSFSPTAKALTNDFEKAGAQIAFCTTRTAASGGDAFTKTAFVDDGLSETEALYALIKGMRFLTRSADYQVLPETRTIRGTIIADRTMAADTGAVSGAVCYELRNKRPALWRKFKEENPSQAVAYAKQIKRSSNRSAALEAAFKAFFTDKKAVRRSDEASLVEMERRLSHSEAFSGSGADKKLGALHTPDGETYVSPAELAVFSSPLRADKDIAAALNKFAARVASKGNAQEELFCTYSKKESIIASGKKVGTVLAAWFKGQKTR